LQATHLTLRSFRNYASAAARLPAGATLVHGPVGAGKTNLLDAVHVCCTGKSCRTANERDLIRFGDDAAHISLDVEVEGQAHRIEVGIQPGRPKVISLDGSKLAALPPELRPPVCVFIPDRLELVKGPAAVRRPQLDAFVAALWPARAATKSAYGRALAQRNALLGRVRAGLAAAEELSSWERQLAHHGIELMRDRGRAIALAGEHFPSHARGLGLEHEGLLRYRPRSPAEEAAALETELYERREQDLERGFTTHGPHRDDFSFEADGRDLRRFGSQGQQRIALLALLLAQRDALAATTGRTPIMLLDDVLSELDKERRARLLGLLANGGQTLITTADPRAAWEVADGLSGLVVSAGVIESDALEAA
jgi:DNA replication and repair protein RecF